MILSGPDEYPTSSCLSDVEINAMIEDISFEIISDRVEIHARSRSGFQV